MNTSQYRDGHRVRSRATRDSRHRGFHISVAACERSTGAILATARLSGGPARLVRTFALRTDARDVGEACDAVVAELEKVIDDLLPPAARAGTARPS